MDKRLEFSERQREIIGRYNDVVKEMLASNIRCVYKSYGNIYAFNGANVADVDFPENRVEDGEDELIDFDELEQINSPIGLCFEENDNEVCITFFEEGGEV